MSESSVVVHPSNPTDKHAAASAAVLALNNIVMGPSSTTTTTAPPSFATSLTTPNPFQPRTTINNNNTSTVVPRPLGAPSPTTATAGQQAAVASAPLALQRMQIDSPLVASPQPTTTTTTTTSTTTTAMRWSAPTTPKSSTNTSSSSFMAMDLSPKSRAQTTTTTMMHKEPVPNAALSSSSLMACADPVKSTVPDDASSSTITGTTTTTTTTTAASSSSGLKNRRQKRLERNRESARLSRRRRKQYLEVLEERVSQLSHEMDCGRRHHAAHAVGRVRAKRAAHATLTTKLPLPSVLLRTSAELRVAATFGAQQLHSFCAPPAHKFALWLTLQADDFFRGGRAASERLSAARIGERMLQNGTDRVTPAQTMWPLFCNEIGLSYDQEEKVRLHQRSLLQGADSWLSRHTAHASTTTMATAHQVTQSLALAIGNRERQMTSLLTEGQRVQLAAYLASKVGGASPTLARLRQRPPTFGAPPTTTTTKEPRYQLTPHQHVAANLYILNHRLAQIHQAVPMAAPMVTGPALKKLSRRPSFESLGARSGEGGGGKNPTHGDALDTTASKPLSRDSTFASTGSLKRSASEMSVDDTEERQSHRPSVDPMAAQAAAADIVQKTLGHVQAIIPPPQAHSTTVSTTTTTTTEPPSSSSFRSTKQQPPRPEVPLSSTDFGIDDVDPDTMRLNGMPLPDPVPVAVLSATPAPTPYMVPLSSMDTSSSGPAMLSSAATSSMIPLGGEPDLKQQRRSVSSGCLGVVPEEIWSSEAAEDFLMSFVDEDWAIGGGIETDT